MAAINPLRYRGYYYDSETGWYYLQSRYYDPVMHRFINADSFVSTGTGILGYNMFAYCNNNPVSFIDETGTAHAADWWTCFAWLCATDGSLPIADTVYIFVGSVLTIYTYETAKSRSRRRSSITSTASYEEPLSASDYLTPEEEPVEPEPPDVTYPGDDPTVAPEGTEWRGKGAQGGPQGNYYNPNTGESWHPDLDHPEPIGPHWDYNYKGSGVAGWRIFPDGRIQLK